MKVLVDTHVALWAVAQSASLPVDARRILEAGENTIYYSVASVWEVAIKHAINPSGMPMSEERFVELCDATGFLRLPIEASHVFLVKHLNRPKDAPRHKDPFDRLLIAQAKAEGFVFLTHDSLF